MRDKKELPPGAMSCRLQKRRLRSRRTKSVNESLLKIIEAVVPSYCSIIDIGAGHGRYVLALRELGYDTKGVDGTIGIEKLTDSLVEWVNLTEDCSHLYGIADWGLFLDVGEHVPEQYENVLIDEISKIPSCGLIVSWGSLGQRGTGHVNCHSRGYIISLFVACGDWRVFDENEELIKRKADKSFRDRLIVFER